MTLILSIQGRESIWLLADRRLSFKGLPPQDTARKIMFLDTTDGMAILGYCATKFHTSIQISFSSFPPELESSGPGREVSGRQDAGCSSLGKRSPDDTAELVPRRDEASFLAMKLGALAKYQGLSVATGGLQRIG